VRHRLRGRLAPCRLRSTGGVAALEKAKRSLVQEDEEDRHPVQMKQMHRPDRQPVVEAGGIPDEPDDPGGDEEDGRHEKDESGEPSDPFLEEVPTFLGAPTRALRVPFCGRR
jgi:hypothetical protein